MKFDEYRTRFRQLSDDEYLDDLLAQAHINAEILCQKFWYLRGALMLLLIAAIPWTGAIYFSKLIP